MTIEEYKWTNFIRNLTAYEDSNPGVVPKHIKTDTPNTILIIKNISAKVGDIKLDPPYSINVSGSATIIIHDTGGVFLKLVMENAVETESDRLTRIRIPLEFSSVTEIDLNDNLILPQLHQIDLAFKTLVNTYINNSGLDVHVSPESQTIFDTIL